MVVFKTHETMRFTVLRALLLLASTSLFAAISVEETTFSLPHLESRLVEIDCENLTSKESEELMTMRFFVDEKTQTFVSLAFFKEDLSFEELIDTLLDQDFAQGYFVADEDDYIGNKYFCLSPCAEACSSIGQKSISILLKKGEGNLAAVMVFHDPAKQSIIKHILSKVEIN